jgi:hypothetical protein
MLPPPASPGRRPTPDPLTQTLHRLERPQTPLQAFSSVDSLQQTAPPGFIVDPHRKNVSQASLAEISAD